MQLKQARKIGMQVVEALTPRCERIAIAGSVRRDKPDPKDVEIVLIPAETDVQVDLFTRKVLPYSLDQVVLTAMLDDLLVLDPQVKRDGPKYKRFIHVASGAVVEIFAAEEGNWGYIWALRTGPADFMKLVVTPRIMGGALPHMRCLHDGWVWRRTPGGEDVRVWCSEERDFFAELRLPWWAPEERTVERLRQHLNGGG